MSEKTKKRKYYPPKKPYRYVVDKGADYFWGQWKRIPQWEIMKAPGWRDYLRFDNYWLAHGFIQRVKQEPPCSYEEACVIFEAEKISARWKKKDA